MPEDDGMFGMDEELQPGQNFLNFSDGNGGKISVVGREGYKPPSKERPRSPPANGHAKITYPNGDIYEGNYEGGMRHGKGIMKFADGRQYRGKWRLDMPHGQGEEVKADRTTYKGEYHQGRWNGHGVEITVYGDEYSGEWRHGERHGKGDYFSDGLRYEGEWRSGRRFGRGKCIFRNGDSYEGEFESDLMHGDGTMVLANGCRYSGAWVKGKMEGHGEMIFPTGDVYNGEWRAGKKDGKGTYKSANGSMYVGQFENGKRHGSGMQRSTVVQASNFKTTIIPYRLVEAEVYNGAWKFGKRCGKGTIHVKDQLVYDGEFMNDQRDGQGTGYLKNGSTYTGAWKSGKMHGKGKIASNGQEVQGIWEEGVCKQTIDADFDALKGLEMGGGGGDMMDAFDKGRNRLLIGGVPGAGDFASSRDSEQLRADMDGTPGYLHDIVEGDEEPMAFSPEAGAHRLETASSRDGSTQGDRLPDIQQADRRRTAQSAAAVHDEQVHLSGRYGVPMRGTFDVEGRYIPPVSTDTLREWNLVNNCFTQTKDGRKNANRKQATGLAAAESVYIFEQRMRPGYGEGRSVKEAKLHVPRKTQAMEAGPGEFSFKRWRMERHL